MLSVFSWSLCTSLCRAEKGNLGVPLLPGQGCSFYSFKTNTYKLNFLESPSGIKVSQFVSSPAFQFSILNMAWFYLCWNRMLFNTICSKTYHSLTLPLCVAYSNYTSKDWWSTWHAEAYLQPICGICCKKSFVRSWHTNQVSFPCEWKLASPFGS